MIKSNKKLASIFLIVFLDLLGFSLILPLLPYYADTFGANAAITGFLVASYAAAQLFGAPLLGRLSDRFGRRPILLVSVLGTFAGFLLLGFARSIWMLFVSRIIDGFTGGNLTVAQAYITDVTDAKGRTRSLGIIGAAFGLGFIIGPVVGGLLSQWGYSVPAFTAAGLALVNLLLVALWLPESLPVENRSTQSINKPVIDLVSMLAAIRRPFTGSLLITRFFFGLAFSIFQTIFSLYALTRFELTATQTGYILTYVGVLSVFTQGFLVGRLINRVREDVLIGASVAIMALSLLGWALVPSVISLMIILAPASVAGGLLTTLLSSTLTRTVNPLETGGILGLAGSIDSLTRLFAPMLGGVLLGSLGTWAPGVFGGIILGGLSLYVWRTIINHPAIIKMNQLEMVPQPVRVED